MLNRDTEVLNELNVAVELLEASHKYQIDLLSIGPWAAARRNK